MTFFVFWFPLGFVNTLLGILECYDSCYYLGTELSGSLSTLLTYLAS